MVGKGEEVEDNGKNEKKKVRKQRKIRGQQIRRG